jgi:hypothetical protein
MCGAIPIVTCMIEGIRYAVFNVNMFDDVDRSELVETATNFEGETTENRLTRRRRNWTPEAVRSEAVPTAVSGWTPKSSLLAHDKIFRFQPRSRLEKRRQDTENQLEQLDHREARLLRVCFASSRIEFSVRTGRPQRMIATRLCSQRTSSEATNEIAK